MSDLLGISGVYFQAKTHHRSERLPHHGAKPHENGDRFESQGEDFAPPNASKVRAEVASGNRVYFDKEADARDRAAYYGDLASNFDKMSGAELFDNLSALVSKTHTKKLDYSPSTQLYPWVDLHPDMKIKSIYSGAVIDPVAEANTASATAPTGNSGATIRGHLDKLMNGAKEWALQTAMPAGAEFLGARIAVLDAKNMPYNCEHVVPQSWFDKKEPMRGDLHHLFACDTDWNSKRGNLLLAELPEWDGGTSGPQGKVSSDQTRFEPAGGKGAVARATLYMLMRYPGVIGDEGGEYSAKDLKTLVEWSNKYPVTVYEKHRNQAIFAAQGNRNPLIDYPQLASKIDFARGLGSYGREG